MGQWVSLCVWSVVGWLIAYQDGDYFYPGQYSQTIYSLQIGAGTFSWQDPVHSWKEGPGEVMTVEDLSFFLLHCVSLNAGDLHFGNDSRILMKDWDWHYCTESCFIYILDSSNSSSITSWTIQFGSSSRSNWAVIWTSNSNGSWTDKSDECKNHNKQILKWCWNVVKILLK